MVTVFEQNHSGAGHRPPYEVGQAVFLHWDEAHTVLLDE
jgi:hypothetical protein